MSLRVVVAIEAEEGRADHICDALKDKAEVASIYKVLEGPYDVIVEIQVRTIERYRIFAVDEIGSIEGIIDYISFLGVGPGEEDDY